MDIATALTIAESIVTALVKAAPAIEEGIVDSAPYVQAIGGMISGSNATIEEVNALLALVNIDSADFQTPLPPDDGTTTT